MEGAAGYPLGGELGNASLCLYLPMDISGLPKQQLSPAPVSSSHSVVCYKADLDRGPGSIQLTRCSTKLTIPAYEGVSPYIVLRGLDGLTCFSHTWLPGVRND